jgi:flagellar basal body-associated protein FliL
MEADNKKKEIKNVPVETYAEDMAQVIGADAGGIVKKIIHSDEEREMEKKNLSPESKKNKIFILVGFLLLIFALVIALFLSSSQKANTVPIQPQFIPLVFTDKSTSLEISGLKSDDIKQMVLNEINNTTVAAGGVEGIYLTENKKTIGLRRFITLTESHFVPNSNTAFVSDNFLMGVVKNQANANANSGTGFFILIKVRSATDIFDSLRASEPNLLIDLHGFLGININSNTNYLFTKNFTDGIIQNKNARILYDQNGNIVLMYIFADDNSVLITDSQNAANQIILRLASSQMQQ